jgi:putative tryptophan/tyrosine transport system substrate-binding protein
MKRRELITLLGGAAAAWPLAALAQQPDQVRRIGVLMSVPENDPEAQAWLGTFSEGLQQLGWTAGRNIRLDYRWAAPFDAESRQRVGKELVALQPDLILTQNTVSTASILQETRSIPIIFANVVDPIGSGFVTSLARPGGNITGFVLINYQMVGKWLEMLKEAAPGVFRAVLMFNPDTSPYYYIYLHSFETVPRSVAVDISAAPVRDTAEIEGAIAKLGREPGSGLVVPPDAFTLAHLPLLIRLAQQHRVPAVYNLRESVAQGALMSYGPDPYDNFRRAGSYVDRILKGAKPADLPIQEPTKFELAINLKTARALGLEVPPTLLARADEVIE